MRIIDSDRVIVPQIHHLRLLVGDPPHPRPSLSCRPDGAPAVRPATRPSRRRGHAAGPPAPVSGGATEPRRRRAVLARGGVPADAGRRHRRCARAARDHPARLLRVRVGLLEARRPDLLAQGPVGARGRADGARHLRDRRPHGGPLGRGDRRRAVRDQPVRGLLRLRGPRVRADGAVRRALDAGPAHRARTRALAVVGGVRRDGGGVDVRALHRRLPAPGRGGLGALVPPRPLATDRVRLHRRGGPLHPVDPGLAATTARRPTSTRSAGCGRSR